MSLDEFKKQAEKDPTLLAKGKLAERTMRDGSVQSFVKIYGQADDEMMFEEGEATVVENSKDIDDGFLLLSAEQVDQGFEASALDLFGDVKKKDVVTRAEMGFRPPEVVRRPTRSDASVCGFNNAESVYAGSYILLSGSEPERSGGGDDSDEESDEDDDDVAPLKRSTQRGG